jgi:hypothetical protein
MLHRAASQRAARARGAHAACGRPTCPVLCPGARCGGGRPSLHASAGATALSACPGAAPAAPAAPAARPSASIPVTGACSTKQPRGEGWW